MSKLYQCDVCCRQTNEEDISQDRALGGGTAFDPDWKDVCKSCAPVVIAELEQFCKDIDQWKRRRFEDGRMAIRLLAQKAQRKQPQSVDCYSNGERAIPSESKKPWPIGLEMT